MAQQHWIAAASASPPPTGVLWLDADETAGHGRLWCVAVGHGDAERAHLAAAMVLHAVAERYAELRDDAESAIEALNLALDDAHARLRAVGEAYPHLAGLRASIGAVATDGHRVEAASAGAVDVVVCDGATAYRVSRDHLHHDAPTRAVGLAHPHVESTVSPVSDDLTIVLLPSATTAALGLDAVANVVERLRPRDVVSVIIDAATSLGAAGAAAAVVRSAPLPPVLSGRDQVLAWVLSGEARWPEQTMMLHAAPPDTERAPRTNIPALPPMPTSHAPQEAPRPVRSKTEAMSLQDLRRALDLHGVPATPPAASTPETRPAEGTRTAHMARPVFDDDPSGTVQMSVAAVQRGLDAEQAQAAAPRPAAAALPDWPTLAGIPAVGGAAAAWTEPAPRAPHAQTAPDAATAPATPPAVQGATAASAPSPATPPTAAPLVPASVPAPPPPIADGDAPSHGPPAAAIASPDSSIGTASTLAMRAITPAAGGTITVAPPEVRIPTIRDAAEALASRPEATADRTLAFSLEALREAGFAPRATSPNPASAPRHEATTERELPPEPDEAVDGGTALLTPDLVAAARAAAEAAGPPERERSKPADPTDSADDDNAGVIVHQGTQLVSPDLVAAARAMADARDAEERAFTDPFAPTEYARADAPPPPVPPGPSGTLIVSPDLLAAARAAADASPPRPAPHAEPSAPAPPPRPVEPDAGATAEFLPAPRRARDPAQDALQTARRTGLTDDDLAVPAPRSRALVWGAAAAALVVVAFVVWWIAR